MAARRGKRQAKRNSDTGTPAWVWLIAGVAIGAVVLMAAPKLFQSEGDGFLRVGPRPNPDAVPAPIADADIDAPASVPSQRDTKTDSERLPSPQYDFYTLLPGNEVQMSDAELAALSKAENERRERLQREEAARAATALAGQAPALPAPLDETPAPARTPAPMPLPPSESQRAMAALEDRPVAPVVSNAPQATSQPVQKASPAAAPSSTQTAHTALANNAETSSVRYLLQAGAFGNSNEAEGVKARLAMSGLAARVEPTQINGGTVYRVRMGPYQTASDLSEAKSKLESSGLQAMAIKVQ